MAIEKIPVVGSEESPEEKYEKRLKELEKANRGLIEDLQSERQSRHQLEQEIEPFRKVLRREDPVENRVEHLAQDPDGYIRRVIDPYFKKLAEDVQNINRRFSADSAYRWLAKQENVEPDSIPGSDLEKDIVRITKENGLSPLDHMTGVRMAYVALQREREIKNRNEGQREETISNQSGERVPPLRAPIGNNFTDVDIASMTDEEYEKNRDAILASQERGQIKVMIPPHPTR